MRRDGHERFVVAGDARQAQLVLLGRCQVERCDDCRRDARAQGNCAFAAARMDSIGEQDDVGVCDRIDPQAKCR